MSGWRPDGVFMRIQCAPEPAAGHDSGHGQADGPGTLAHPIRSHAPLAKPNYSFEKRQRELAKKKKKDEKLARKQEARDEARPGDAPAPDDTKPQE